MRSLRRRLLFIAALTGAAGIVFGGAVLWSLYRASLEQDFDARLNVYLDLLIVDAVDDEGMFAPPQALGDPNFEIPLSGWAWQVDREDGERYLSPSLVGTPLARLADGARSLDAMGMSGLRALSRSVTLPDASRSRFTVVGDAAELDGRSRAFLGAVVGTLAVFAAAFLLSAYFQIRVGLAPLDAIQRDVRNVATGAKRRIDSPIPRELVSLVASLNELLRLNEELLERSRTHVGNLAHALKTPLSVILNEARDAGHDKIVEQTRVVNDRIDLTLDRARRGATSGAVGRTADVRQTLDGLARAMNRIYDEQGVAVAVEIEGDPVFRGEKQDLEELVGNVLDNACKWAAETVVAKASGDGETLRIIVDDDGPGLPADKRKAALKRGERLDERVPGSGLGLSIVVELVRLYGGEIDLSVSPAQGLRVAILLPAVT